LALKYARRIALLPRRTMEGIVRFATDSAKLTSAIAGQCVAAVHKTKPSSAGTPGSR